MSVQTQAISFVPGVGMFHKYRKIRKLLVLFLVASVLVVACCAFTTIALISSLLGMANSMGVFGDGKLSEYIGYASIAGSVLGMAGNMAWPGGGVGSGFGTDGFGIGHSTETYNAAATAFGTNNADYMENMSMSDRIDMDQAISENQIMVDKQLIVDRRAAAANATSNQTNITSDVKKPPTSLETYQQNQSNFETAQRDAEIVKWEAESDAYLATPDNTNYDDIFDEVVPGVTPGAGSGDIIGVPLNDSYQYNTIDAGSMSTMYSNVG